jgi:hypothetical protein
MKEMGLQSKCQTVWFEKIKNSLSLKFKPYNISWTGQTRKDFIHASEIHSELLFRHSSCYSDTGVSQPSPLTKILSRDLERVVALTDIVTIFGNPR